MLYKDPLVHFIVIGGLLFAGLSLVSRPEPADDTESILISAEQVADLARTSELLQGRPLTDDERARLVADAVRDEVYYRRALALGLDIDDDEVRRRLIEKMQYLSQDLVDPEPPEADLEAFFESNPDMFRIPELASFEQVFFSPRMRGETVLADAEAALAELNQGGAADQFGDSTPLSNSYQAADPDRVRILFGEPLADAIFSAEIDSWIGPFESDFGWHLVRVSERSPARDPAYEEVQDRVREAYATYRREEANRAAYDEMLTHFEISVQWEPDSEPEDWP